MGDVIEFSKDGWNEGRARCIACQHEWVAVARVGEVWLQCPNCETVKGLFQFSCSVPDGGVIWKCLCGSEAMFISPANIRCCSCGKPQRPYD